MLDLKSLIPCFKLLRREGPNLISAYAEGSYKRLYVPGQWTIDYNGLWAYPFAPQAVRTFLTNTRELEVWFAYGVGRQALTFSPNAFGKFQPDALSIPHESPLDLGLRAICPVAFLGKTYACLRPDPYLFFAKLAMVKWHLPKEVPNV